MDDAAAIVGTWEIVRAELAGDEMPEFVAGKIRVEFGTTEYAVRFDGQVSDRGTYALSGNSPQKSLHLTGLEGTNAGRTILAIYQLVGNRLRICYGLDGLAPTEFATAGSERRYLATYRRIS
jgi:uncharacterized protein (TIGR03067 family)